MRFKIEHEMLTMGAPTGRLGYTQMACAIELILQNGQVMSTTRVLYPKVAERCNTKAARIERNVREEIKAIWTYGNQERLNQLFINRGKYPPGNKEFLYTVARHLQQRYPNIAENAPMDGNLTESRTQPATSNKAAAKQKGGEQTFGDCEGSEETERSARRRICAIRRTRFRIH